MSEKPESAQTWRITLCEGADKPEAVQTVTSTWPELVAAFSVVEETECHPCPGKHCKAKMSDGWVPVDLDQPYRTDDNVLGVTAAVFDLDHITIDELESSLERVKSFSFIAHSTHNHLPPGDCAVRLIMPLAHPVSQAQWRRTWAELVNKLQVKADPTCKNPSRFYLSPTIPKGRIPFVRVNEGEILDVNAFVPSDAVAPPEQPIEEVPVEIATLREMLSVVEKSKARSKKADLRKQSEDKAAATVLARIRQGLPIAVSGDHAGGSDLPKGRDTSLNHAASLLAYVLPQGTPWEAVAEIMRGTIHAMSAPEGVTHWHSEVRDMFNRAARRRQAQDETDKRTNERIAKTLDRLMKRKGDITVEDIRPTAEDVDATEEDPEAWKSALRRDERGNVKGVAHNIFAILAFDESTRGTFRWNDVTRHIEVSSGRFGHTPESVLSRVVANWLSSDYGIEVSSITVGEQILALARAEENTFDPIRDFLRSVVWDKTPRIDTWLLDYCHASTLDENGNDITHLVKLIGRKFLLALAARGLKPGVKVDDTMVLEGDQSIGKSTALDILGGEWFTDAKIDMSHNDSRLTASRTWLMEFGELASLRSAKDIDTVKTFLTTRVDTFRPPYGRVVEQFPRRCIFAGTVNPIKGRGYLSDETGNRRFRPVLCTARIDTDGLRKVREQLFAEAVARVAERPMRQQDETAGEAWWYSHEENDEVEARVTAARVEAPSTAKAEEICRWWHSLQTKPEYVLMSHVLREVFPDLLSRADDRGVATSIGSAMIQAGFKKGNPMKNGERFACYYPQAVKQVMRAPVSPPFQAIAGARSR
jgi:predicted P-loop ATPase